MIASFSVLLFGAAVMGSAIPAVERRVVQSLNQQAFAEAQQRDPTATRAFSSVEIKTSSGQCLFVNELSGDFRANLTPVQVVNCNGTTGEKWDIITSGKHNNVPGTMLVVNTLTQACLNFDPRRNPGNQVILFSCGGRGDGGGQVTNSQLFAFTGGAGPLALTPENSVTTCLTVKGSLLDQTSCSKTDPNQSFTFGNTAPGPALNNSLSVAPSAVPSTVVGPSTRSDAPSSATPSPSLDSGSKAVEPNIAACSPVTSSTTSPTVDQALESGNTAPSSTTSSTVGPVFQSSNTATPSSPNLSTDSPIPVSRAGGFLNPSAAAEANQRDDTATRAFSSVSLKSAADGKCLSVNPTAGDFRENLIPIELVDCTGAPGEKFDFITAGKHINRPGSTLIVSTLTEGCLNFDSRRAAGDTVIMFACGGRGDGTGQVSVGQLFSFTAGQTTLPLTLNSVNPTVCLVPDATGRLDQAACDNSTAQLFTIA